MKKFFSLVMLLICLIATGCQKEDDAYKHYDLKLSFYPPNINTGL